MSVTFTLSSSTQNLINIALQDGPGTNNVNYFNAYNAISAEIAAHPGVNSGTAYWFSQAGSVNGQMFNPTPAGTYIWAYTQGAAATLGYNIPTTTLQKASDNIAQEVFNQLANNNFVFTDDSAASTNFAPQSIVADDAGEGITNTLGSLYPGVNFAEWGGTLFAQTVLNDPTYLQDNNIVLTPGNQACTAILAGDLAGTEASLEASWNQPAQWATMLGAATSQDYGIIAACILNGSTSQDPYGIQYNLNGTPSSETLGLSGGLTGIVDYSYNSSVQLASFTSQTQSSSGTTISDYETNVSFDSTNNTSAAVTGNLNSTGSIVLANGTFDIDAGNQTLSISNNASASISDNG